MALHRFPHHHAGKYRPAALLNNFVGEFLVLQGTAITPTTQWTIWASVGVILSACYMLWMYQRVFYGEAGHEVRSHVPDLNYREWAVVVPLIVMMVWMGVYSQSFLPTVGKVTARVLVQERDQRHPKRVQIPETRRKKSCGQGAARGRGRPPRFAAIAGGRPMPAEFHAEPGTATSASGSSRRSSTDHHGARFLMVMDHNPAAALFLRFRPPEPAWRAAIRRAGRLDISVHRARNGIRRHAGGGWFRHFFPGLLVIVVGILTVLSSYRFPGAAKMRRPASTMHCCSSPLPDNACWRPRTT